MRILILSQFFTPEPTLKGLVFAKALAARGHQVQVLTGFPNYPGGMVYPGYRIGMPQRENLEGISVVRVPLYPSHDSSAIRRISNYASFALSASVFGCPIVDKADVIYTYHPPATVALPALVIGLIRRIPFVYDIQDLWPDTLRATGMVQSPLILNVVGYWCRFTYRHASKLVVLSQGFKDVLMSRGVPQEKIEVIHNWCEEDEIIRTERNQELARKLGLVGKFTVVFAGTMGKAQDLDTVLAAAQVLRDRVPRVQIVLIGGGIEVDRLKKTLEEKRISNVTILPRRPVEEISEILNLADALLVHLRKDPLFHITIPSKIQAYLAVGKPILVGVEGDATTLVLKGGAGVAYDPASSQDLAAAVERMANMPESALEEMGSRGYQFYQRELSFERGVDKFERLFRILAVNTGIGSR